MEILILIIIVFFITIPLFVVDITPRKDPLKHIKEYEENIVKINEYIKNTNYGK